MPNRETQILPNELLVRWDDNGVLQGAHIVFLGKVLGSDGSVLAAQPMPPQAIALAEEQGFPLSEVLGQLNIDALKRIEFLEEEINVLKSTMARMTADHQEQLDQLIELQAIAIEASQNRGASEI